LGDVAVCAEVCAEQARRHRCTLAEEIERMIVHGLVHLLGLDHERSPAAFKVMSALEKSIRSELKIEFGAPDFCRIQERPAKAKRGNGRS
jgi:rRNA maturation RNase YbeY